MITGILMWELFSGGKTPYPSFSNPQVFEEVSSVHLLSLCCEPREWVWSGGASVKGQEWVCTDGRWVWSEGVSAKGKE